MNVFSQVTSQTGTQSRPLSRLKTGELIQRWLVKLGHRAIAYLTQGHEPKITHRIHAKGHSTWRIDDPYSGQSLVCHSVAEVREWLEARYSLRRTY